MDPIPFVTSLDSKVLQIEEEAVRILSSVTKPIKAVAIAGTYRTGKSFLLNRLMRRMGGFPLGKTVNSMTKGIWIWVGDHPGDMSKTLVLLDTEGLNDVEKGDKSHDLQILTLSILLSSIFVCNCPSAIGADTLEGLELASSLAKDCKEIMADNCLPKTWSPEFVMALRDFQLDLSEYGSPEGYLEASLAAEGSDLDSGKAAIKANFPQRSCFTFPPPVSFKRLRLLDQLSEDELDPDFMESGKEFTKHVTKNGNFFPQIRDTGSSGKSYVNLAKHFVDYINNKDLKDPTLTVENLTESAFAKVLADFGDAVDRLSYPAPWDELFQQIEGLHAILVEKGTQVLGDKDHAGQFKLNMKAQEVLQRARENNEMIARGFCKQRLEEKMSWILNKYRSGGYYEAQGLTELQKDLETVKKAYVKDSSMEKLTFYADLERKAFWNTEVIQEVPAKIRFTLTQTDYFFQIYPIMVAVQRASGPLKQAQAQEEEVLKELKRSQSKLTLEEQRTTESVLNMEKERARRKRDLEDAKKKWTKELEDTQEANEKKLEEMRQKNRNLRR